MRRTAIRSLPVVSLLVLASCGGSGSGSAEPLTGAEIYDRSCATCHADDGGGFVGPPVIGVHERLPEAEIIDIIANGRVGETGAMPGWSNQYSAEEIATVADYLRTLG